MRRVAFLLVLFSTSPARAQNSPIRLRPPGGGMIGLQLQNSTIATWASKMADEAVVLRDILVRAPINPASKQAFRAAADLAVRQTTEVQTLANRPGHRDIVYRAHQEADVAVANLVEMIQRSGLINRDVAQAVSRLQYADTQLELAFAGHGGTGDEQWRRRVARVACALEDQAGELRAIADETLTAFDRNLDRAVRQFAFGCAGVERNIDSGVPRERIVADVAELARRWQTVTAGLGASQTANAAVRAQAARVDSLFGQLLAVVQGGSDGGIILPPNPDFGFIRKGSAFAVGAGEGGGPRVRIFTELAGLQSHDFFAYDPNFRGGVRVAVADLNGDGVPDIVTAPGPGMPPLVRVFDGRTLGLMVEFLAYEPAWTGGVQIAAADLTRNGMAMVVTGADGGGGPHVRAFDLAAGKVLDNFFPYHESFRGGVRVAVGDVNGDGIPDVITAPGPMPQGSIPVGPVVRVFDGRNRNVIAEFNAYVPQWQGGIWVATGDITKNGRAEIFTGADAGGGPHVRVFDGINGRMLSEFYPFPMQFTGGVRVAATDVNGDGVLDFICASGPSLGAGLRAPPVRVFDGRTKRTLGEFLPFEPAFRGGAYVGAK